jgi:hypothetical protein
MRLLGATGAAASKFPGQKALSGFIYTLFMTAKRPFFDLFFIIFYVEFN